MAYEKVAVLDNGIHVYIGLSSDTKPTASTVPPGSQSLEANTGNVFVQAGGSWHQREISIEAFKLSGLSNTDLTMDGTAQFETLAAGVRKIRIINKGATTENIRVAFGATEAEAETNLTIVAAAATTGLEIQARADGDNTVILGVPDAALGGSLAVCNGTASDTQVLSIAQGA